MLVSAYAAKDAFHEQAVRALKNLQAGAYGRVFVTNFVIAETLNFFVARARDPRFPERLASELLGEEGPPWLTIVTVDESLWRLAREKFRASSKSGLSFTDCTSIAAIEILGLDGIVSYDSGFDGIVRRITE
jgi:hypothetical protein